MPDLKKAAPRQRDRHTVLGNWLEKQLTGYTAIAGAAGVSLLALAGPAEADIVYTPANIRVPQTSCCGGPGIFIDLNHDGIADFEVWDESYADFGPTSINLLLYARNAANGVEGAGRSFAARLQSGSIIGSSRKFAQARGPFGIELARDVVAYTSGGGRTSACAGPWAAANKDGYLGLRFEIAGQIHYGWIRLTSAACIGGGRVEAIITGYAYNTEPNQPILAGQESASTNGSRLRSEAGTLGQLALGSLGLQCCKRNEEASVAE